ILLIPPLVEVGDLVNYPYGTKVLARYPETTTFYPAIVVGNRKDGNVRLKFDGEEEVNKETEKSRDVLHLQDRSCSPVRERERSRSPAGDKRDSYSRRDYGYSRGDRKERDYRGRDQGRRGDRRGRGGRDRGDGGRGDRDRGDRDRDFNPEVGIMIQELPLTRTISLFDRSEFNGRQIFVRQDYPPPDKKKDFSRREDSRRDDSRRDDSRSDSRRDDYGDRRGGRERRSREDFGSERKKREREAPRPGTEIFVGNLPFSVNWQALKDLMRDAGSVVRADVRVDSWGKSRGFGTVVFETPEDAQKAVEMFSGYEIQGRRIDARPGRGEGNQREREQRDRDGYDRSTRDQDSYSQDSAVSRNSEFTEGVTGDGEKSDTIFVANLPFATSNDDLYELFETVGRTTRAEIQYNEKGKPSGNAVVQFELLELSENAIQNLDNYTYGGRNIKITYANKEPALRAPSKSHSLSMKLKLTLKLLVIKEHNYRTARDNIAAGFSSANFDLEANVAGGDTRKGLSEEALAEIQRIMDSKRKTFDEARLEYTPSELGRNGVDKDGVPLDPKLVTF
ncbi:hypothetical protein G9P44_006321, partial [Scheffersomyces stipitis]